VRNTHRASSVASELVVSSVTPDATVLSERPSKRKRTGSSLHGSAPTITPEVESTQQAATEARNQISKELSTNGLLSIHQRSVLETAISFVDHLSHAPVCVVWVT
jgi:hypothetical protein